MGRLKKGPKGGADLYCNRTDHQWEGYRRKSGQKSRWQGHLVVAGGERAGFATGGREVRSRWKGWGTIRGEDGVGREQGGMATGIRRFGVGVLGSEEGGDWD